MAPHSSTLAWKIPWTEEPGGLQPIGSLESDTTEWLHFHFSLSCIGEGNGNPLQCSWLENPRDGGAWWAVISGVSKSQIWLKQLSSSSRSEIPWGFHMGQAPWLATLPYSENFVHSPSPELLPFRWGKVSDSLCSFHDTILPLWLARVSNLEKSISQATSAFQELWSGLSNLFIDRLVAQTVKNPPAMQETWVWSLGREDPLEEGTATHASIFA